VNVITISAQDDALAKLTSVSRQGNSARSPTSAVTPCVDAERYLDTVRRGGNGQRSGSREREVALDLFEIGKKRGPPPIETSGYPIRPRVRGKPLRCCARPD
jgi:hypothetical protein